MRLALSSDHAGFELKRDLAAILGQKGHAVLDLGTHSTAPVDYPDAAESVAEALRSGDADRGIIVCGSGAGVSIAANKFPGIRAAVCHDTYTAHQAVEHDDMNVLCLGSRVIGAVAGRRTSWAPSSARRSRARPGTSGGSTRCSPSSAASARR